MKQFEREMENRKWLDLPARMVDVEILSREDGTKEPAQLLLCPNCPESTANAQHASTFCLSIAQGHDHAHLECVICREILCEKPDEPHEGWIRFASKLERTRFVAKTKSIQATLICCPVCEDSADDPTQFGLYLVGDGLHPHIQCARCTTTFCQTGACGGQ